MKKLLFSLLVVSFLVLPVIGVFAAETTPPTTVTIPDDTDIRLVIEKITNWIFYALVITAVIVIVISGFMFVTGGGKEESIKTARNMLMYALIGIIIAFLARAIVTLVLDSINTP